MTKEAANPFGLTRQYVQSKRRQLFLSYDDPGSIRCKSRYAVERALGGVMFWESSGDPRWALLDAIGQALNH